MDAASGQLSLIARALRTGVKLSDLVSDAAAADSPDSNARGLGDFPTPAGADEAPGGGQGAGNGNRNVPA
ncbi:MAG TPA: hypothetical protein VG265_08225 [Gaiellaceae bacterium]|nr:hypothetical protein [Gaiellaceae bacterium]